MHHEHPLRILRYSMRSLWLLIFPLLRGVSVMHFDPAGIYSWIKGAWMDIAVLGIILLFGFIRWYFSLITATDSTITHTQGCFIRVKTVIPLKNISSASSAQPFYLVPFNAIFFSCDTRAGIFRSTDLKIMVTKKVCAELMSHIPTVDPKRQIEDIPGPTAMSILLFSVFFSSGFSGAVYIAAFFFKGGDLAHDLLSVSISRITETTEMLTAKLIRGIPHVAIAFGSFFIAAWLLSFILNLLRYSRFRLIADNNYINIVCGITNRRRYRIKNSHINYTDLRQNLLMKLLNAVTVSISCAGYGNDSSHLPVLLPIRRRKDLGRGIERLGVRAGDEMQFRPKWTGILSYIGNPLLVMALIFVIYHYSDKLVPQLSEISFFLTVMLSIPTVWLIVVKIVALSASGITIEKNSVVLCTSEWTAFHTVTAEKKNIVLIETYQTFLQRIWKTKANLRIWFSGESSSCYTIRALTLEDCGKITKILERSE